MKFTVLGVVILCLSVGLSCSNPTKAVEKSDSWQFPSFTKLDKINPILTPSADLHFTCPIQNTVVHWEERNVLNPTAVVRSDSIFLIYRAQDSAMTSRLGMAMSTDGLHFEKLGQPVFYPNEDKMKDLEWPGGVEDPRIVASEDGKYIMTYTSYDGKTARLCLASSLDLRKWSKHGPVLSSDEYNNTWSKSGAIVSRLRGSEVVATRINNKYWMYFGDTDLFMASSEDLIHWEPLIDEERGHLISVLNPRPGYFDSRLVEPGPFALLNDNGIVLIYNASNASNANDSELPIYAYAPGQALFDSSEPYRLIDRSDTYMFKPDRDYERIGEVNEVCFVEGLIFFKDRWILYYGTADSKIAVAVSP